MNVRLTRRSLLKLTSYASATYLLNGCARNFILSNQSCSGRYLPRPKNPYPARVVELVNDSLVIDMAVALVNCEHGWKTPHHEMSRPEVDFLASSGISIFHLTPGLPEKDPRQHALAFIKQMDNLLANNEKYLQRINDAGDFDIIKQSGKLGLLIGFQNSTHFLKTDDVDDFWRQGQRVSQITQNEHNLLGSGAIETEDKGLSNFGAEIIKRMNQVGMAVDLAHCGDQTTLDAIAASNKPVLFTHANCRALNSGYMRNKTDDAIKKMAATGGVMGLTGLRAFVRDKEPTTIEHFLDHVDHVARIAGIEHVGIGSDQDVVPISLDEGKNSAYYRGLPKRIREFYQFRNKSLVDGLNQVHRIYAISEGLIRRGYSDNDIRGVLGLNFKRALKAAWS